MDSKRSHYRVTPREGAMRVTLVAADSSTEGEVLNLSIQGAGASFPLENVPAVSPGERVRLEFRNLLLLEPLVTEAAVRRMSEVDGTLQVGFEFTDPRALLRDVPYVLRPYFNRRRAPRVTIEEAVEVAVVAPGVKATGWLRQLGTGGASISVSKELASKFAQRDQLELRFALPGCAEPFWLLAVLRGVWQDGEDLGLSVRFDRLGTVDFKQQRERIVAAVTERNASEPAPEGQQAP